MSPKFDGLIDPDGFIDNTDTANIARGAGQKWRCNRRHNDDVIADQTTPAVCSTVFFSALARKIDSLRGIPV